MKIYGSDLSFPANKARMAAYAVGIDFDYIQVNLKAGDQRVDTFLDMNPIGKIPVLDDDGFYVFESNAIARYLGKKVNSPLFPSDLQASTTIDQWMEFISHHIGNALGKVLFNTHFYSFMGVEKDERSLSDGRAWLEKYCPVLDSQLKENEFLTGPTMTMADICMLATCDPFQVIDIDM